MQLKAVEVKGALILGPFSFRKPRLIGVRRQTFFY